MTKYQYVYVMKDVSKFYGHNKQILKNIWLSFFPGAKIGVIGFNGAGKSTLLRIMAGVDKDITGEAWAMEGIKVGYLPQEPKLDENLSVYDNIVQGLAEKKQLIDEFNSISTRFAEPMSDDEMNDLIMKQADLQEKIDACGAWELDREIDIAMDALRCPPKEVDTKSLSGGEKRRVALCKLLLEQPDMLLLDEPTNHLDAESVAWLEHYLREYKGTVVLVTHDRYFLDKVTNWILEIDRGEGVPWEANYSKWLQLKQEKLRLEQKAEDYRQKQLEKELDWIKQSPKARQSKSKARISSYDKLVNQERNMASGTASIVIAEGPRLGDLVIEANSISKAYDDKILFENLSFNIPKGAVIGVIGPNGAGKTTLFNIINGKENADSGTVKAGDSVKIGYVDQTRDQLNDKKTVWEEISEGSEEINLGGATIKSRAYCSLFNFKGSDQQKTVGNLSGGERNRVHMSKLLKEGNNVILLDEPTNDLDVDTLRALEEAIESYSGCVLVISHDRWFLDRIATHIMAFEGESQVVFYEGNYTDYEEDKRRRLGPKAEIPSRIKYRKLSYS